MSTKTSITQQSNIPSIEDLYHAKAYFGHKKEWSHPAARPFLYGIRQGIYIINLEQTRKKIAEAIKYLKNLIREEKTILFVGTKTGIKNIVQETGKALNMPYVSFRWLGGTLTNYETIKENMGKMERLEGKKKSEFYNKYTKKEKLLIDRELEKLHQIFDGISQMKKIPDILFVIDTKEENTAVREAKRLKIPVIGICDANCNPNDLKIAIPANDDAKSSVELIMKTIVSGLGYSV